MDYVTEFSLAEVYQSKYRELFLQGLANEGPLLEQAQRVRRSMIHKQWSNPKTQELFMETWQQVQTTLDRVEAHPILTKALTFCSDDLQNLKGTPVPAFKLPWALSYVLPESATDTILGLSFLNDLKKEITSVFAESELKHSTPFFRTVLKNRRSVIYGSNSNRVSSLLGVAHELGHCLVENLAIGSIRNIRFTSESIAQVLEEIVVVEVLKSLNLPLDEWAQYQRRIDMLNFQFLALEFKELAKDVSPVGPIFKEGTFVFRDSLFLNPGYQIVYASSSNLRLSYLCQASKVCLDASDWNDFWRWAMASIQKKNGGTDVTSD